MRVLARHGTIEDSVAAGWRYGSDDPRRSRESPLRAQGEIQGPSETRWTHVRRLITQATADRCLRRGHSVSGMIIDATGLPGVRKWLRCLLILPAIDPGQAEHTRPRVVLEATGDLPGPAVDHPYDTTRQAVCGSRRETLKDLGAEPRASE